MKEGGGRRVEGERKGDEFRLEMEKEVMEGVMGGRLREMWKRKRDVAEELEEVGGTEKRDDENCFQKCKKTPRSPVRKGGRRKG